MLSTFFLSSPSLNDRIKFCAMCRTQNTWLVGASCHPFCGSSYTLFIDTCLSEMSHMFACGVTCCLRFFKKKLHASLFSSSTIAKAMGNILLFPSCATTNNNVPLYLPYNQVASIWTIGLQNLKLEMHGRKAQKRCLKTVSFTTSVDGSV